MIVVGQGAYRYEATHDWGDLPDRIRWGNVHSVQVDRAGLVYVHHTVHSDSPSDHAVVVFDPGGDFVTSWGGQFAGGAHGMQLVREGSDEFLYFCDIRRSIVQKTDLAGNVLLTLGYPRESPAYAAAEGREPVWKPTNLAVASNGDIYVADGYGSSFVVVWDRHGRYKNTFGGGKTDQRGELNVPHGIAIDRRSGAEEVLVADRSNHRLQWFSLDGEPLRTLAGDVDLPCHFDQAPDGTLLIPDLAARVTLLDKDNRLLAHLGQGQADYRARRLMSREHFLPGQFVCPHGACFDHEGNIFVGEWVEIGRLTFLRKLD
ncbi:MAG: hypothetical protein GC160_22000 [Acidobacteria bacterium]|nr:hypothetical protein [Acidobacteriota bacterium]